MQEDSRSCKKENRDSDATCVLMLGAQAEKHEKASRCQETAMRRKKSKKTENKKRR